MTRNDLAIYSNVLLQKASRYINILIFLKKSNCIPIFSHKRNKNVFVTFIAVFMYLFLIYIFSVFTIFSSLPSILFFDSVIFVVYNWLLRETRLSVLCHIQHLMKILCPFGPDPVFFHLNQYFSCFSIFVNFCVRPTSFSSCIYHPEFYLRFCGGWWVWKYWMEAISLNSWYSCAGLY